MKEICLLDTSICSEALRKIFLENVSQSNVTFRGLQSNPVFPNYLNWLFARDIKVDIMSLKKGSRLRFEMKFSSSAGCLRPNYTVV